MAERKNNCRGPRGVHEATHPAWGYRREALVWINNKPLKSNLIPFASEMALWLRQKSSGLPLHTKFSEGVIGEVTNPYSYSLGTISVGIGAAISDAFDFVESAEEMDAIDAEVKRIRLESELTLNAARFCEATIKQMLYCTQFPPRMYEKAAMGQLLAQECENCRKAGRQRHDLSLLGSLAHRFFLCHILDNCAVDHLQLVARRRNLEAAHSDSQSIHPRGARESREQLAGALSEIGQELGHMADHIGLIESKMIAETALCVRTYPRWPAWDDLSRIPVRDLDQYPQEPEQA